MVTVWEEIILIKFYSIKVSKTKILNIILKCTDSLHIDVINHITYKHYYYYTHQALVFYSLITIRAAPDPQH